MKNIRISLIRIFDNKMTSFILGIVILTTTVFAIQIKYIVYDQALYAPLKVFQKPDIGSRLLKHYEKDDPMKFIDLLDIVDLKDSILYNRHPWLKIYIEDDKIVGYTQDWNLLGIFNGKPDLKYALRDYYKKPGKHKEARFLGGWVTDIKFQAPSAGKMQKNIYLDGFHVRHLPDEANRYSMFFYNADGLILMSVRTVEGGGYYVVSDIKWKNKNTLVLKVLVPLYDEKKRKLVFEREENHLIFYGKNKMKFISRDTEDNDYSATYYRITDTKGYLLPKYMKHYKKAIADTEEQIRIENEPFKRYKAMINVQKAVLLEEIDSKKYQILTNGVLIQIIGRTNKYKSIGYNTYEYMIVETTDGKKGIMLNLFFEKVKK